MERVKTDRRGQISLEDAIELLLERVIPQNSGESVPLSRALGRIAFEDIGAVLDQPPFDRSPLDGYAVNHLDIEDACLEFPATLRVAQNIFAGDVPSGSISRGEAARIMNGSPLPPNATCVVRQEDTDEGEEFVQIFRSHGEYENYCFRGEDFHSGQILAERGDRLNALRLGLIAGQGSSYVNVFPRPSMCVLSTGSEILAAGSTLEPGKIYDSNGALLSSRGQELGADVLPVVILPDDPYELSKAMGDLLPRCDLIVATGGVSVGAHDFMPQAGEMMGARTLFHRLPLKPGGATMALEKDGKLLLCLSGNSFAAYATFELMAAPVLRKLMGEKTYRSAKAKGIMENDFDKPSRIRRFVRARIEGERVFLPEKGHYPGMLSSLTDCNCLIDVPAGTPWLKRGDIVDVVLFATGR
jgi:molybdopterin molybdotransferase